MGINQVSLFFFPPKWVQRRTPAPDGFTLSGEPVTLVDAVPSTSGEQTSVRAEDVKQWLVTNGFANANWGAGWILERGKVDSVFGPEKEIQVVIGDEAGELTELYCRFTLPRRTEPSVSEWTAFVCNLCQSFLLRLGDDDKICNAERFRSAVRNDHNYQSFAKANGWNL